MLSRSPASAYTDNSTWAELLIGYELEQQVSIPDTYSLLPALHANLEIEPTMRERIEDYRKTVMNLLANHFTIDVQQMFEAPRKMQQRGDATHGWMLKSPLLHYGITGAWQLLGTRPQRPR